LIIVVFLSMAFIQRANDNTYHEDKINYFLNEIKTTSIDIKDYGFFPKIVTINPGDGVFWENNGLKNQGISFDDYNETGSDILIPGMNYTKVFMSEGIYDYHSSTYPYLIGKIIVKK